MPRPFKKKIRSANKTMNEKDSVVPDDHETDEGVTASAKGEKKKQTSSESENNDKKVKSPIKAVVIKSPIKAIDIKSDSSDSSSDSSSSSSDSETGESNKIRNDEAGSVVDGGDGGEDVNASEQSASEITCNSDNYEGYIDNLFEASQQQKTQQQRQQQHHQNHQDPGGGGDGDRGGGGDGSHSGEGACAANSDDRASSTNLIINYLPQNMTDKELYDLFSSCGSINTCKIMRDFKTGYSFGYGFVDFNEEADSEDAIQKFNGFLVRNKRLKVSYARPGGQSIKDTNLYVINLSRNINDDQLDRIFSPFGLIVQRNILRDRHTGRPRGVAFVRYNKREEAQEAIAALNNTIPENGSQPIFVRLAEEHGKAKAAQFMSQVGGGGVPPHMSPAAAQQQMAPQQHHMMGGHMQQPLRPAQYPRHQQQAPYQQQQQHQPQHIRDMQQHFIHQYNLQPPLPHHMQQLQPHPHGGGGGRIGVGVGGGGGVGLPQSIHGGSGGYHHNMANRAASHR